MCLCRGICLVRCCCWPVWILPRRWGGQPGSVPKQPVTAGNAGQRREPAASSRTEPNCLSWDWPARLLPTACGLNAWPCLRAELASVSFLGGRALDSVGKSFPSQSPPCTALRPCSPCLPRAGAGCAPQGGGSPPQPWLRGESSLTGWPSLAGVGDRRRSASLRGRVLNRYLECLIFCLVEHLLCL